MLANTRRVQVACEDSLPNCSTFATIKSQKQYQAKWVYEFRECKFGGKGSSAPIVYVDFDSDDILKNIVKIFNSVYYDVKLTEYFKKFKRDIFEINLTKDSNNMILKDIAIAI